MFLLGLRLGAELGGPGIAWLASLAGQPGAEPGSPAWFDFLSKNAFPKKSSLDLMDHQVLKPHAS